MRDAVRARLQARHPALDQVHRFEAPAELPQHAEPVERQRFLQPFGETRRCGDVQQPKLALQSIEGALGVGVRRVCVRRLQLAAPRDVIGLREIAYHIFTRVPLAPLHGHVAEHILHRRAEALRPVEHDEQRAVGREAALDALARRARPARAATSARSANSTARNPSGMSA